MLFDCILNSFLINVYAIKNVVLFFFPLSVVFNLDSKCLYSVRIIVSVF